MLVTDIIGSVERKAGAWVHERAIGDILDTPPIVAQNDGLILFSMIGTAVLLPYLVAVKSFHAQVKRGRVMLLDDGTLTGEDKAILAEHCDNPVIIRMPDVATAPCPKGNCWERLLAILDLRADNYVIQLDSDTVTTGPVPDVVAAIDANRSFTLAGGVKEAQHGFMDMGQLKSAFYPERIKWDHVQALSEEALTRMPGNENLHYIRGCAGFAGFSKSDRGREAVTGFSTAMHDMIGARWNEWGSEQVASNFVVANDDDPVQLPYTHYVNHWIEALPKDPRFIHYIGTFRYKRGSYARTSKAAIDALKG